MRNRRQSFANGLVGVASLGLMVFGSAGPAAAATGAQTGWEYAPAGTGCTGLPPQPQSGFEYATDLFVLTDPVTNNSLSIEIGPNVAAPQGAAAGTCATNQNPVVPSLGGIAITRVWPDATQTAAECTGVSGTYTRVNSTVTIHFTTSASCGGATTWDITGNQNVCGLIVQFNPECATDPGFPFGNASSHLVTTYMSS